MQTPEVQRRTALLFVAANDTRWNSTLYMLQRYLQLAPAVQRLRAAFEEGEENQIPGLLEVLPTEEVLTQLRACMVVCA